MNLCACVQLRTEHTTLTERRMLHALCMRRLFLRSQPFLTGPHGTALVRCRSQLHACVAATAACLAAVSGIWLIHAHEHASIDVRDGQMRLGQATLQQLWAAQLPMFALVLRSAQVATACALGALDLLRW